MFDFDQPLLVAAGAVWSFLPCATVALFYAMLSGSWLGGAVVMSGFGLRTWPMLIATGLGIPAAPPPRNLGVAAQHGGSCHHHTGIASTGVTPTNFVALRRSGL